MTKLEEDYRIAGGFAGGDAPFAVHPNDEKRARETVRLMEVDGLSRSEMVDAFRAYIAVHCPRSIEKQMARVRQRLNEWLRS